MAAVVTLLSRWIRSVCLTKRFSLAPTKTKILEVWERGESFLKWALASARREGRARDETAKTYTYVVGTGVNFSAANHNVTID